LKKRTCILFLVFLFSLASLLFAEELKDYITIRLQIGSKTAYVNEEKKTLDCTPQISNSRTLVPLRFISESMGGEITFNQKTREIVIKFKNLEKISNNLKEQIVLSENLMKEIERLKSEGVEKSKKLEALEYEIERCKVVEETQALEIQKLKDEISKNKEMIDKLNEEFTNKKNEIDTLTKELVEKRNEIEKLKKEFEEYRKNTISVTYPNIDISFFGKKITPTVKPFLYNEKVMVSLEDIATAMNVRYRFDTATGKVVFGDVPKVSKIGQRIIKEPYAITVHGKRSAGKYVIVEATIENLGKEMFYVNSQLNFSIEDKDGRRFDSDLFSGGEIKNNLSGEVRSGNKLRGEIGFEMESKLGLVFWYRPFYEKEIYFTISLDS